MKSSKNFIRVGVVLLLSCVVSSTVLGTFTQRFMKMGNLTTRPSIIVQQGDINKKVIQRDLLAPSGALALVALLETTEVIEISADNYLTAFTSFPTSVWNPEIAFKLNDANGFQTIEIEGNGFRYPISSKCAPLINTTQMPTNVAAPIWPTRMPINNRTSSTIVFTKKTATGTQIGAPFLVTPNAPEIWMNIDAGTRYLEITFPGTTLRLYSFKYRDPEINIEKTSDGVVFKDGTYRYPISGTGVPKITMP